jgi:deoxyribonuclease V
MKSMENKPAGQARNHVWEVSPEQARAIQEQLRKRWEGKDRLARIHSVAGLDAAFVVAGSQSLKQDARRGNRPQAANRAIGCAVVYGFPEVEEIARAHAVLPLHFPYVPGLLSFREAPVLLAALAKLGQIPDLLFCDAQGYAHPRRFGLACHLGVLLDCPTIGCAKSLLIGSHGPVGEKAGSWTPLVDEKASGELIGGVLRTRTGVRPIYISQGHRVSLESAIQLTLMVTNGFRIPRPTRDADHFAGEIKRKLLGGRLSEK